MAKKCPICGDKSVSQRKGKFRFDPPDNVPGGTIVIPNVSWQECTACGEVLLPPSLSNMLAIERYRRLGLLRPEEIKATRARVGLTQTEMAQLVGVGEKTYTRWEAGRSIQNKSNDNLIRLADKHPEWFVQLDAQRNPEREELIREYLSGLHEHKGAKRHAMAAHGTELDPSFGEALRDRLRKIARRRKKKRP